jgi:hypothetical protein
MFRELEYRGHHIAMSVLLDTGDWGFRVDEGLMQTTRKTPRPHRQVDELYEEAETAAKAYVDAVELSKERRASRHQIR